MSDNNDDKGGSSTTTTAATSSGISTQYVTELQPDDVLFGRGSGPNDHAGNIRFRQFVSERKTAYMSTSHRVTKAKIAREIVDLVQGRFLKKLDHAPEGFDENADVYEIVDDHTVMEKAKQALRQNATKTREEAARQKQRPAAATHQYTQSLPLTQSEQAQVVAQQHHAAALYDFEPIPLKSESSLPQHPPPAWENTAAEVIPEMQISAEVLPIPPSPPAVEEDPYYGGGAASGPPQQQQQPYQQQQQAYLQQHHHQERLPRATNVQQQHRHTASAPPQMHQTEQSMAEIPSEEAFIDEGRRSSMNMSDLFKARHEHQQRRHGGGGGGNHNNSSLQVHQLRRPPSPVMDELMDSFSQMRATGGSTYNMPDHERSRLMASTETMGTIEHLGSAADMSIGTMGSSTFSLFGPGRGNESSMAFDAMGGGGAGAGAANQNNASPAASMPPSTSTGSTRSSKLSHHSEESLSIHDVYCGDGGRRKSSSLSSSTANGMGMAMTSSSTINGKITEVMRQVDAEAAAALPRNIGIEEEDSLVMGDSSMALLKSALKEGDDDEEEETGGGDCAIPPSTTYTQPNTSTTLQQAHQQQQQSYYKNY